MFMVVLNVLKIVDNARGTIFAVAIVAWLVAIRDFETSVEELINHNWFTKTA